MTYIATRAFASSFAPHTHDDADRLTLACPACVLRVEADQRDARYATAPLRRTTWTFTLPTINAPDVRFDHVIRVPAGADTDDLDARYGDSIGAPLYEAIAAALPGASDDAVRVQDEALATARLTTITVREIVPDDHADRAPIVGQLDLFGGAT